MNRVETLIIGCGYVGLRVGRTLAARGERVAGTTRTPARAEELDGAGIAPVVADVLDPASLSALPDADRVLYCIAHNRAAGVPMRTVSVDGLRHALECLRGRIGRWVQVSTSSVYGGNDGAWVDEDTPAEPTTESGRVCLDAENLARGFAATNRLALIVLRFTGLYGPGRIIRRLALERGETIAADPEKFVNLIHIDDAVASAIAALDGGEAGRLYLASDDRPVTRRELYGLTAEHLGAPAPRFDPPAPGLGEINKRISNHRLQTELGVTLVYPDITTGIPASIRG